MANYVLRPETLVLTVSLGTPQMTVGRARPPPTPRKLMRTWLWVQASVFIAAFCNRAGEDAEKAMVHAVKWLYHWLDP